MTRPSQALDVLGMNGFIAWWGTDRSDVGALLVERLVHRQTVGDGLKD